MKRLISFRKRHKVFGRGSLEFLESDNRKVLSFLRRHEDERVLVVTNLSRFAQCVELDLSEFKGTVPLELFGQTRFPPVGDGPYSLTLGPHTFYWFALLRQRTETVGGSTRPTSVPSLTVHGAWDNVFRGRDRAALEAILASYLSGRRWFAGKGRTIQTVEIGEAIPVPHDSPVAHILLVRAIYAESESETYVLPVAFAPRAAGPPGAAIEALANVHITGHTLEEEGLLYDAMVDRRFTLAPPRSRCARPPAHRAVR
jgi:maltose alpha-D-glucosyltransferase/alpha-amylase